MRTRDKSIVPDWMMEIKNGATGKRAEEGDRDDYGRRTALDSAIFSRVFYSL